MFAESEFEFVPGAAERWILGEKVKERMGMVCRNIVVGHGVDLPYGRIEGDGRG